MLKSLREKLRNTIYGKRNNSKSENQSSKKPSRVKRILISLVVVALLLVIGNYQFQSILELLKAPTLPELQTVNSKGEALEQYWPDQNWGGSTNKVSEDTQKFHHISQGTATLPIPYKWFLALEKPDSSLWSTLFKSLFGIKSDSLSADGYLLRFGFIRSAKNSLNNPDGLPMGFAKTDSLNVPGYPTKTEGIGFTCAACHTAHFIHGEGDDAKEYVIEGGPAATDIGQLTVAITAALGQTGISSKIPFFDGRFDRFAKKVLGSQYNDEGKALLAQNFATVLAEAQKGADIIEVQEGFTRLDALNRIGNQVFSKNAELPENYQPINAPVNYPFLWTTSWFKWVQYDGSIMRPLIRNAGESMGVNAHVSMTAPKDEHKFQSSIPMGNLYWIEEFLKGKSFNDGLRAPTWPFDTVKTTDSKYLQGKASYEKRCQGCHLEVVENAEIEKRLQPIKYFTPTQSPEGTKFEQKETADKVLDLHIIPVDEIGTDPAQGNVLATRVLNTAGNVKGTIDERTTGMGINQALCGQYPEQVYGNAMNPNDKPVKPALIDGIQIADGGNVSFGLSLGAIVQQTIDAWFDTNGITDPDLKEKIQGGRPNCLQAGQGYKARPLNGVWATAPFLHNGSVATIKDLICTAQEDRPKYVRLGNIRFDDKNLGLIQPEDFEDEAKRYTENNKLYTKDGYFILDASIAGNSNLGHSFSDSYNPKKAHNQQDKGVIGSKIGADECNALIDYLKTI